MTQPQYRTRASRRQSVRADIQGLRAVAVLLVLLFHLWPNRVTGGYVGVDVFFVISGFLITGHLVRDFQKNGRISLARFWSRRAIRLLPASLVVIAASLVAVLVLVPASQILQFVTEGAASAAYVVNWVLAAFSVDYLAADNLPSPFQHFWTLSVEEQFYILVPLLLVIAAAITRSHSLRTFRIVLGSAALLSLGYGIWLTATTPAVAYFSTFTRAWEFLAGALLALVPIALSRGASAVVGILGVAGIIASAFLLDSADAFPGWIALLPVLSTVAVIAAGPTSWVDRASRFRPVLWLGNISYSLYLWHWPLIVLVPYATGRPLSTVDKILIGTASIALAWLSYRFVESPVRFSPRLDRARRPGFVFVAMAASIALIGGVSFGAGAYTNVKIEAANEAAQKMLADGANSECFGAGAVDPTRDCPPDPLGDALIPDPAAPGTDTNRVECWTGVDSAAVNVCSLGPESGYTRTLFAVGDSHNSTLIDTYETIAEEMNWRIDLTGHNGCYWTAREQDDPNLGHRENCTAWKANITDWLDERPAYDGIFTMHASSRWQAIPVDGETQNEATANGMSEVWATQAARGTKILAIRDNPVQRDDVKACIDMNRDDPNSCALPRDQALAWYDGSEDAVAATPGATLIDFTSILCNESVCPVVIGNAVVYSDRDHMTGEFAQTLAPYIADAAKKALGD